MDEEERLVISIVDVDEKENKTAIDFELSDEVYEWFRKNHCSRGRFNNKSFKRWMARSLRLALVTLEKGGYKTIYSRLMGGTPEGVCRPKVGDIVVFFSDGYRTRIVSRVTKTGVEFEKMFESDRYRRTTYNGIFEITRPRSKRKKA